MINSPLTLLQQPKPERGSKNSEEEDWEEIRIPRASIHPKDIRALRTRIHPEDIRVHRVRIRRVYAKVLAQSVCASSLHTFCIF